MFDQWIQALNKIDYIRKKDRPDVGCILCSIRDNDERVTSLKIYQDDIAFISLNLFPYNPGHLLLVPNRHVESFRDLRRDEVVHLSRTLQGIQNLLEDTVSPSGYNIGINEGPNSGASIEHLHYHIVPRYPNELGFIDITSDTRVVIEGLESVMKRLKNKINEHLNDDFFKNFK